jgi:hypothetical protein
MDRIDEINHRDQTAPAFNWWDPATVINDEHVSLLMYVMYSGLIVYYCNTINGKLTTFVPHVNNSIITSSMSHSERHV